MKLRKIKSSLTDEGEMVEFQGLQHAIPALMGEMHLQIIAIDPIISNYIKSATFSFPNREEGLKAFNALTAIARNVHKTCVDDVRLYSTVRTQIHH